MRISSHARRLAEGPRVGSTTEDVLDGGAGVCQDYAHLAVAACRTLRIRYDDVPPIRRAYSGQPTATVEAGVDMRRMRDVIAGQQAQQQ